MAQRYRANEPRFVDETIDDEALIMDMARGSYYSCTGASAAAWNALKSGATVDEVAQRLAAVGGDAPRIEHDLAEFLAALLADELLVPLPADAPAADSSALDAIDWPTDDAALELERFTDLADLLLLDPVHDVSEAGWPRAAE